MATCEQTLTDIKTNTTNIQTKQDETNRLLKILIKAITGESV